METKEIKNAPKKIYLQIDDDGERPEDFDALDGVTWCEDRLNDSDLCYVLDTAIIEALTKEIEEHLPLNWDSHKNAYTKGLEKAISLVKTVTPKKK